jgi:hypothetical protein
MELLSVPNGGIEASHGSSIQIFQPPKLRIICSGTRLGRQEQNSHLLPAGSKLWPEYLQLLSYYLRKEREQSELGLTARALATKIPNTSKQL